jgi:hypothetical protein
VRDLGTLPLADQACHDPRALFQDDVHLRIVLVAPILAGGAFARAGRVVEIV